MSPGWQLDSTEGDPAVGGNLERYELPIYWQWRGPTQKQLAVKRIRRLSKPELCRDDGV